MKVLVTGAAGFIGHQVSLALLARGDYVIGLDNLNHYYNVNLKKARLQNIASFTEAKRFHFECMNIADDQEMVNLFNSHKPDVVVHLAAQAGVRYSIKNPMAYTQSNLVGFTNILECCRHHQVKHLVYASSSSVYGGNTKLPFSEMDNVDAPVSLYAATKKANELMAHTYSHLYNIPTTGLRFFTVYGPWGRPDMSPFLFADAIVNQKPIKVFNYGDMMRDFTYIDDIVECVVRVLDKPATACQKKQSGNVNLPYKVFNIGNSHPEKLLDFIAFLEDAFGQATEKIFLPMQDGDVKATYADTSAIEEWIQFKPSTPLRDGLIKFATWYRNDYISKISII